MSTLTFSFRKAKFVKKKIQYLLIGLDFLLAKSPIVVVCLQPLQILELAIYSGTFPLLIFLVIHW